jgi:hypothetical protein
MLGGTVQARGGKTVIRGALAGRGRGGTGRGIQAPVHPLVKHHMFVVPSEQQMTNQPPSGKSAQGVVACWEYTDSQGFWIKFDPMAQQKLESSFLSGG